MPPRPAPAPRHRRLALAALTALVLALHGWVLGPAWTAFELRHAPARALPVVTLSQIRPPAPPPPAPPPAPRPAPRPSPKPPDERPEPTPLPEETVLPPPDRARPDADLDRPGMDAPPPSADDEAHALQPLVSPAPWLVGYTATKGAASGRAQLDWQPLDEQQYRLTWRLELAGRESLAWQSQGHVGPAGLMPDRMVERRQGRDLAAVNFQRDKGLVSFSGPSTTLPLPAGAQDRASWLLQLPMLAAAVQAHWTAGHSSVSLPVFTTRGEDQLWRFTVVAEDTLPGPQGTPLRTWRLAREPVGPYDSRVEVWLARDHGLVPLRLRFTTPPSDVPLELQLSEGLPPAEPDMPRP
jgi:hypothetical protein